MCNSLANNPKLQDLLSYTACLLGSYVIPLIFAIAIVVFVWGVVQYVINDSEEAKKKGKDFIIWGIIGLTVMISVWGLIQIVGNTFNLNTSVLPYIRPPGSSAPPGDDGQ